MRVLKLINNRFEPVIAIPITNNSGDIFFNIKHGSYGNRLWVYTMGLDKKHFIPNGLGDEIELKENNYSLIPVIKNKKTLKDKLGNIIYYLTKDSIGLHKRDILLFWEITLDKKLKDITYELSGNVTELGRGIIGKNRGDAVYRAPAPVLEITGDCKLKWSGSDMDDNIYSETIIIKDGEIIDG